MNKYAVISSNSNLEYATFLPLTALFWKMVGYKTICILTEDFFHRTDSGVLGHVFRHLTEQPDVRVYTVGEVPGFKSSTVAQVSRLLASALPIEEDSYLLTGDVDMLPLSPGWFNQQDFGASFHVFNADAYGSMARRNFPICYLGGTRVAWKSLMGLGNDSLTNELSVMLQGSKDHWFVDEGLIAAKMQAWPLFDTSQLLTRGWDASQGGYASYRLDRGNWHLPSDLSSLIDCHSARPLIDHWDVIGRLVAHFLPADSRELAQTYVQRLLCF